MDSILEPSSLTATIDELPVGVVVLDAAGRVVFYNQYEEALSGRPRRKVLGSNFFREVAPCTRVTGLAEVFAQKIGNEPFHFELDFRFPRKFVSNPCDVHLELVSLAIDDVPHGALLVQDVSSIRAVERTKDLLSRLLSHDMRSPLTAATAQIELTLDDLEAPSIDRDSIESNLRETRHALTRIQSMLEDLNDVTHLETGSLPALRVDFDLSLTIERIIEEKGAVLRQQGKSIEYTPSGTPITIHANDRLVARAVDNLIENAIQHGAAASAIQVRARRESNGAVFEVEDRGVGVSENMLKRMFQPGHSGVSQPTHGPPRGLGLALVKLVADHHGGEVVHEVPAEGGACFRLTLPNSD